MKHKITKKLLENAEPRSILFTGYVSNSSDGIFMANGGGRLLYVITRGGIADWKVFVGLDGESVEHVRDLGDKVHQRENIENIAEFNDEVWGMYNH